MIILVFECILMFGQFIVRVTLVTAKNQHRCWMRAHYAHAREPSPLCLELILNKTSFHTFGGFIASALGQLMHNP